MAKKSFIKATESSQDIYEQIARGTRDILDTQNTKDIKKEYYRFNLKMPIEYKDYLQEAAYKASNPKKVVTMTEYICRLIEEDMKRNKCYGHE